MHELLKGKKRLRIPSFWTRCTSARPHFCTPEQDTSYWLLKRAPWIWRELAWGSMQMYVTWPEREMKHCYLYLHPFLLNKTSLVICL